MYTMYSTRFRLLGCIRDSIIRSEWQKGKTIQAVTSTVLLRDQTLSKYVAGVYVERAVSCSRVAVRRAPSSRPPFGTLSATVGLAGRPVRAKSVILVTSDDCLMSDLYDRHSGKIRYPL
jgi:hypothetical protein